MAARSSASTSTVRAERIRPPVNVAVWLAAWLFSAGANGDVVLTEGTNLGIDVASDGRIAIDLLGGIWVIPRYGGEARVIAAELPPASRPRWSPDDKALVYQSSTAAGVGVRLLRLDGRRDEAVSDTRYPDQHPDWHPGGERIVFSSARDGRGFDIWEIDLPTRLAWRLTHLEGNETEPAWSSDGRHLLYVHEHEHNWSLMLRRHGQADEVVATSDEPIAAPSWRPDGSLVSYLSRGDDGWSIRMTILSAPPVDRALVDGEDFFLSPVAWLDRQRMLYTADGHIRERRFDSWTSMDVPFRARVGRAEGQATTEPPARALPAGDAHTTRTIVRAGRLFDGVGNVYRRAVDVVIDGGRITAVEPSAERADGVLIDLGDITVIPGFVDAYAALPDTVDASLGPLLLGLGVTTMVADRAQAARLGGIWDGREIPGPRLLPRARLEDGEPDGELPYLVTVRGDRTAGISARGAVRRLQQRGVAVLAHGWRVALGSGAGMMLASDARPLSPGGRSYDDVRLAGRGDGTRLVSGLADAGTPHVDEIWRSRPGALIAPPGELAWRLPAAPDLAPAADALVLGSRPNGLPPGIAVHAELRAMTAAGLTAAQALRAGTANAAAALGLSQAIGRVTAGASADLLMLDGDPLGDVREAINIVAVVRNGRFYSLSGLIDLADRAPNVE